MMASRLQDEKRPAPVTIHPSLIGDGVVTGALSAPMECDRSHTGSAGRVAGKATQQRFHSNRKGAILCSAGGELGVRTVGRPVTREFGRYIFVGAFAFACDASTLYVLTEFLRVHYLISAAAGFGLGLIVNYLLSRSWVFARRTLTNAPMELAIFSAIGIAGLGLNEAILWTFSEKLGIHYLFAKGVSGGVVLMWNFGARKVALFR